MATTAKPAGTGERGLSEHITRGSRHPLPWAALAWLVAVLPACGQAPGGVDSAEEAPLAAATQGAVGATCVTIQRINPAVQGAVQDAQIAADPTDPTKDHTNYGSLAQMKTGFVGTETRQILIRFDLATIPAGSVVQSATLTFRMIQSIAKGTLEIHRVLSPWSETAVTWSSFGGAFDPAVEVSLATLGVPNNSNMTADLKGLVSSWVSGASPNQGFLMGHPGQGYTTVGSAEAPTFGPRPKLDVCYFPPACDDGVQNGGEQGVDCGGPCADACCSHGSCTQGAPLDSAACGDPCVTAICAADPFCCSGGWDDNCVAKVGTVCGSVACTCGNLACDGIESCTTCPGDCACTCGHDVCVSGGPLDPAVCVDPCVGTVCATDPFCCTNLWDSICASEVLSICGSSQCNQCGDGVCQSNEGCGTCPGDCGACLCAHDTCTSGGPLGAACTDPCVATVCAADPFCCASAWDGVCVSEVQSVCNSIACVFCGDGVCGADEGCSSCSSDCGCL